MAHPVDFLLILALILGFVCLGFRRVSHCVYAAAAQGIVTGILLLVVHADLNISLIVVAASSMAVKGLAVPWFLMRSVRRSELDSAVEPFLGFNLSMVIGGVAFGASLWLSSYLELPYRNGPELIIPVSLATVFIGLVALVSRRKAITQVAAFLVLENGIFMFSLVLVSAMPALVEMGVLLDLFAAVFVMGVAIHNINQAFDHIDTSRLNRLHDLAPGRRWRMRSRRDARMVSAETDRAEA